jgi:hypothetical protein
MPKNDKPRSTNQDYAEQTPGFTSRDQAQCVPITTYSA